MIKLGEVEKKVAMPGDNSGPPSHFFYPNEVKIKMATRRDFIKMTALAGTAISMRSRTNLSGQSDV